MLGSTLVGKPGNSGEKSLSAAQYCIPSAVLTGHEALVGKTLAFVPVLQSSQCLNKDSPAWSAPRIGGHRGGRCPITFLGRSVISEMPEECGAQADLMQKHTTHDNMEGGAT